MATLSEDVIINDMRLRNRIALPPLTTNYGTPEGIDLPTQQRASGTGGRQSGRDSQRGYCISLRNCMSSF